MKKYDERKKLLNEVYKEEMIFKKEVNVKLRKKVLEMRYRFV